MSVKKKVIFFKAIFNLSVIILEVKPFNGHAKHYNQRPVTQHDAQRFGIAVRWGF